MADITLERIHDLFNRERMERMGTARRYYANDNDIMQRRRMVVGPTGDMIEACLLSNNRLSHSFVKKIVRQKVAYLLGKPFNIDGEDDALVDRLNEICDRDFRYTLRRVAKDAVLCGDGWIAVYYDEQGALSFMRIRPECIGVVYSDDNEENIDLIVRRYLKESDSKANPYRDKQEFETQNQDWLYEVWTKDDVTTYKETGGKLVKVAERPQFTVNGENSGFEQIPFVRFRYNDEGQPILDTIKSLVDDYDRTVSDLSNLLCDTPNAVRIVKGYNDPIQELVRNLATFNTVKLGEGGDLQMLHTPIDIAAHQAHLERLRKDIYDTSCAVDTQEASQGNLSGVAIKFRYNDLDLDCQEMGANFAASMEQITSFVCEDMRNRGMGEHDPTSVEFIWATELMANETEVIQNLMNSADLMSLESRIANHPYVNDPQKEMERMEAERDAEETRTPGEWRTPQAETLPDSQAPNANGTDISAEAADGEKQ